MRMKTAITIKVMSTIILAIFITISGWFVYNIQTSNRDNEGVHWTPAPFMPNILAIEYDNELNVLYLGGMFGYDYMSPTIYLSPSLYIYNITSNTTKIVNYTSDNRSMLNKCSNIGKLPNNHSLLLTTDGGIFIFDPISSNFTWIKKHSMVPLKSHSNFIDPLNKKAYVLYEQNTYHERILDIVDLVNFTYLQLNLYNITPALVGQFDWVTGAIIAINPEKNSVLLDVEYRCIYNYTSTGTPLSTVTSRGALIYDSATNETSYINLTARLLDLSNIHTMCYNKITNTFYFIIDNKGDKSIYEYNIFDDRIVELFSLTNLNKSYTKEAWTIFSVENLVFIPAVYSGGDLIIYDLKNNTITVKTLFGGGSAHKVDIETKRIFIGGRSFINIYGYQNGTMNVIAVSVYPVYL